MYSDCSLSKEVTTNLNLQLLPSYSFPNLNLPNILTELNYKEFDDTLTLIELYKRRSVPESETPGSGKDMFIFFKT